VVVNPHVGARDMHFDQGFDHFEVHPPARRAEQVVDAALAFLDARRGQPTFLYVHTMDAHEPYRFSSTSGAIRGRNKRGTRRGARRRRP